MKIQFRNKSGKLVGYKYQGKKRLILWDKGKVIYRSRFQKRGIKFWRDKVHFETGYIPVSELKKIPQWKKTFTWGQYQDVKTKFFYFKRRELKQTFNMAIGYFSCLVYPYEKGKTKRVVLTKRIWFAKENLHGIRSISKIIQEVGFQDFTVEGYTDIKFVGFTALRWDRIKRKGREGKDLFTAKLIPFIKAFKKKRSGHV